MTLELSAPDDGGRTRAERVEIRGTVTPGDSSVRVAGLDAEVSGGEFSAEVELLPGGNVIDVAATSPGRRPATDAVRVERDMRVPVPESSARRPTRRSRRSRRRAWSRPRSAAGAGSTACSAGRSRSAPSPQAGKLVEKGTRVVIQTAGEC